VLDVDIEHALSLASMLWPLWVARGRLREGLAWFDDALADIPQDSVQLVTLARALTDGAGLNAQLGAANQLVDARRALEMAREIGEPALISRALAACASSAAFNADVARPYIEEAIEWARTTGDRLMLCQALAWHGQCAFYGGDPRAGRVAAEEECAIADALGDRFLSRAGRWALAWAQMVSGEPAAAISEFRAVAADAAADGDATWAHASLFNTTQGLCHLGDVEAARRCADAARAAAGELVAVVYYERYFAVLDGHIAIAAGDVDAAERADDEVWRDMSHDLSMGKVNLWRRAAASLARGDLVAARRWADEAVSATTGWHRAVALTTRSRVAIAMGDTHMAERDAHAALAAAAEVEALLGVPDTLECLAVLACDAGDHPEGVRLFGAADGIRQRTGEVRFQVYQAAYEAAVDSARKAMEHNDFDSAWSEGVQLSTAEATAHARRGRSQRKRPNSGWGFTHPSRARRRTPGL